jgi:molybdopterin/thiamine biosynthesis adenylyltransferase
MSWTATILQRDYDELKTVLFRDDRDEHAAFLYAGLMNTAAGPRFLVRRVVAVENEDFGPSDRRAYRQISARAIARAALECDDQGLCLLWAHSHPGSGSAVGFSDDDLAAHAYAHPALIDILHGRPVAGLVFGEQSVAGEIWTQETSPARLESLRVVGRHTRDIFPEPPPRPKGSAERFARQVLMFGELGQEILRGLTVAVIGAGGGGSLLIEKLAHLGVGKLVIVDFDIVSKSNLSRVVGATPADVGRLKVEVMRDLVARIDPEIEVDAFYGDITFANDARRVAEADFAFLATDSILSRYAYNLLCHQFLLPGIQVGAKVTADSAGNVELVHVMERPLTLAGPCLDCMGVIPQDALIAEQLSDAERRAQRYIDDPDGEVEGVIEDASVITLNAIAASLAATDFLFTFTGLLKGTLAPRVYYPQTHELRQRTNSASPGCRFCDPKAESALARGELKGLSLRPGSPSARSEPAVDSRRTLRRRWWQQLRELRARTRRIHLP